MIHDPATFEAIAPDPEADITVLRQAAAETGRLLGQFNKEILVHEENIKRLKKLVEIHGPELVLLNNTLKRLEKERSISTSAAAEGIGGYEA